MTKILIIEDQPNNMRLIEQILQDMDPEMELLKAETGTRAIQIAKDNVCDLVLTDIALPDMDGVKISGIIRGCKGYEKVPIIAVTAYAMSKDEELFRELFNDYISKPIDEASFENTIRKWIGETGV